MGAHPAAWKFYGSLLAGAGLEMASTGAPSKGFPSLLSAYFLSLSGRCAAGNPFPKTRLHFTLRLGRAPLAALTEIASPASGSKACNFISCVYLILALNIYCLLKKIMILLSLDGGQPLSKLLETFSLPLQGRTLQGGDAEPVQTAFRSGRSTCSGHSLRTGNKGVAPL